MSIQRIQPSKRFSEVVIHNNTAYFAGQVPEKTVKENSESFLTVHVAPPNF